MAEVIKRLCCCRQAPTKEPDVVPVGAAAAQEQPQTVLAKASDHEHIDLELRQPSSSTPTSAQANAQKDGFNANDLVMDEICGVEDDVSIKDNVIEEVSEKDLERINEEMKEDSARSKDGATDTGRTEQSARTESGISVDDHDDGDDEHDSATDTSRSKTSEAKSEKSEKLAKFDEEKEEEEEIEKPKSPEQRIEEALQPSDDEGDEDEIMVDDASPVAAPRVSPRPQMYADADDTSSDEEEVEEVNFEILPPPTRAKPAYATTDSDEDPSPRSSDKENGPVTRVSVKSDGRATLASGGGVRVTLQPSDELTDDDFSEKLV